MYTNEVKAQDEEVELEKDECEVCVEMKEKYV